MNYEMTDEHKQKIADSKKGKRRMHNGKRNIMVPADEVSEYFKGEWQLGSYRKQKYTKKTIEPSTDSKYQEWLLGISRD
jgi:hypothetical protein